MKYAFLFLMAIPVFTHAQQVADPDFEYFIEQPLFERGEGLRVGIDEGHNNFHTMAGRYASFSELLAKDGFIMQPFEGSVESRKLQEIDILVISNPIHKSNLGNWVQPNPSAYTPSEITALVSWVEGGGRLFLIADHMPFGGAAKDLADAFGFTFTNGFARLPGKQGFDTFHQSDKTILNHPVTEDISQIMTFTGQAFQIPDAAEGILRFPKGYISLEPDTAWQFNENTYSRDIENWYQGALLEFGKGRVAVFGEAAMFTTQLAGAEKFKVGMNTEGAEENARLLRNVMAWLSDR